MIEGILMILPVNQMLKTPPISAKGKLRKTIPDKAKGI